MDNNKKDDEETTNPGCAAQPDPAQQPTQEQEQKRADYDVIIAWTCECGHQQGIADKDAVLAGLRGMLIQLACAKCKQPYVISPRNRIVQPEPSPHVINRHMRRAMGKVNGTKLIAPNGRPF